MSKHNKVKQPQSTLALYERLVRAIPSDPPLPTGEKAPGAFATQALTEIEPYWVSLAREYVAASRDVSDEHKEGDDVPTQEKG